MERSISFLMPPEDDQRTSHRQMKQCFWPVDLGPRMDAYNFQALLMKIGRIDDR